MSSIMSQPIVSNNTITTIEVTSSTNKIWQCCIDIHIAFIYQKKYKKVHAFIYTTLVFVVEEKREIATS